MRCTRCDYPLWSIAARTCPECGDPFRPSDFEFVPRSVRFRCPHCEQVYFGTDERGHLSPRSFTCVSCSREIDLDETVVEPGEGLTEEQTRPGSMPWLERTRRGMLPAFFATIGLALVAPGRLIRGVPTTTSAGHALGFGLFFVLLTSIVGGLLPMLLWWIGGQTYWISSVGDAFWFSLMGLGVLLAFMGVIPAWGLVAHIVLRITGRTKRDIDGTFRAMGYSAAASVVGVIPCAGPVIGWAWWIVSATIMLRDAQQVHPARAALAVAVLPLALILFVGGGTTVTGYIALAGYDDWDIDRRGETEIVADALAQFAVDHDGTGPAHASELLLEGWMSAWDLISYATDTYDDEIPIGQITLAQYQELPNMASMEQAVAGAVEGMPDGVVAHRLGDFVFTYHGMDLSAPIADVWTVVMIEDPDSLDPTVPTILDPLFASTADGTTVEFTRAELAELVEEQNVMRRAAGLPPLPDLTTVTHDRPAVATADSEDGAGVADQDSDDP